MSSANNEGLLTKKIQKGEEYAFEIAFLKYYSPLCKHIWKYVRSEALSEEIVQEVFATVWENRLKLNPDGHLRGLLYEIARNKALDYIKHQEIVDHYVKEANQKRKREKGNASTVIDHENTSKETLVSDVEEAIDNLPPKARHIFILNREEGLTYKEIAGYMDISIKTVESHMRRVFQKLRNHLSKYAPLYLFISLWQGVS